VNPTWISLGVLAALAPALHQRLQLSRAKHRSLAGHSRMAKRLARWLPGYSFDEAEFFGCDGALPPFRNSAVPPSWDWPTPCKRATA
jgi:glutamate-1-semialdehyde 2,1-aminomutase